MLDKIYFHYAAADTAAQLTAGGDSHFIACSAGTAAGAFCDGEKHNFFAAFQTLRDKLPKFEFTFHGKTSTPER